LGIFPSKVVKFPLTQNGKQFASTTSPPGRSCGGGDVVYGGKDSWKRSVLASRRGKK